FVLVVRLLVGVAYCIVGWSVGLPKRAPMNKELLALLTPVALCHALGHVMSNISLAAVVLPDLGVLLNFLVNESENVEDSGLIAKSCKKLLSHPSMLLLLSSCLATRFPCHFGYHWLLLLLDFFDFSLLPCIEGPLLMAYGFKDAIAKAVVVVLNKAPLSAIPCSLSTSQLQVATNTLERVASLTHAVGNVLTRVFPSFVCLSYAHAWNALAGNKISTQTGIGTVIAIAVAIYPLIKANMEEKKRHQKTLSIYVGLMRLRHKNVKSQPIPDQAGLDKAI
ncbi:Sugar phosphate transporter domain, partial [Dillenia turbinata]